MVKKRARLTEDNDPLSSTDEVLAGYEQFSQQSDKSASQEDEKLVSQDASNLTSQEDEKPETQEVHNRNSGKSERQQADKLGRQPTNKLTSQQAKKINVRKATFQLNEEVLDQLDKFHLQLRLELGKATPYKEVIVEEAIAQFLNLAQENRDELIESLQGRQDQRK